MRVPLGAVRNVGKALEVPLFWEMYVATRVARADRAEMPNIASPFLFLFSKTPVADPVQAPELDSDRNFFLREILGYGDDGIARVDELGAFSPRS